MSQYGGGNDMKFINGLLELLGATLIIAIALLITLWTELGVIYEIGIILLGAILSLMMYILSTRYEKRLESKLEQLEIDFANQVKATDLAEARYTRVKEELSECEIKCEKYNKEATQFMIAMMRVNELLISEHGLLIDEIEDWDNIETIRILKVPNEIPFNEPQEDKVQGYVCPQCKSSNVRETAHYVICNDCGKRKKKSGYGVKLDKGEY